jgi:hypothetical protein
VVSAQVYDVDVDVDPGASSGMWVWRTTSSQIHEKSN